MELWAYTFLSVSLNHLQPPSRSLSQPIFGSLFGPNTNPDNLSFLARNLGDGKLLSHNKVRLIFNIVLLLVKEVLMGMLDNNPASRWSLDAVLESAWLQEDEE